MKKLKAFRGGQERWKHKGKEYSIVDLTAWPEPTPEPEWSHFTQLMRMTYGKFPIEVAELKKDGGIDVIGRYRTWKEARERVESGHF